MMTANPLYAAVMLKGTVKINRNVVDTLKNLRLRNINSCVLVPADGTYKGMLRKVAEYVTWGEIDKETLSHLFMKKGDMKEAEAKKAAEKALKEGRARKDAFRLSPPTGGLRAVRINYPKGDVGYRGAEINQLLKRMI